MNFYLPFWLLFAEVRIEASKRPDQEPPRGHKAVVLTQQHPKLKMISGDLPTYWKEFQTVRNPNVGFRCQTWLLQCAHQCCTGLLQFKLLTHNLHRVGYTPWLSQAPTVATSVSGRADPGFQASAPSSASALVWKPSQFLPRVMLTWWAIRRMGRSYEFTPFNISSPANGLVPTGTELVLNMCVYIYIY